MGRNAEIKGKLGVGLAGKGRQHNSTARPRRRTSSLPGTAKDPPPWKEFCGSMMRHATPLLLLSIVFARFADGLDTTLFVQQRPPTTESRRRMNCL